MRPNPILQRLGLSDKDRVVIVQADDLGSNDGSALAYRALVEEGVTIAVSVMVPGPWFSTVSEYSRTNNCLSALDIGVHLTVTSEFEKTRWSPISTDDPRTGLLDKTGHFHASVAAFYDNADFEATRRELYIQVHRALTDGIAVTHVNSHMFALFLPKFLPLYVDIARRFGLTPLLLRANARRLRRLGYDPPSAAIMASAIAAANEAGLPLFDAIRTMPLDEYRDRASYARFLLQSLPRGLSCIVFHPAVETSRLRETIPDWRARVSDFHLLTSGEWRREILRSGIIPIDYRSLGAALCNCVPGASPLCDGLGGK